MNDILLSRNYYCTVFNGEKTFVFAYGSEIDDQIYTVEPGQMSESFAKFNFGELIFLLDNFYGLKTEHDIEDFYSLVTNVGLHDSLSGTDPAAFDEALSMITSLYLDDLHSGFNQHSCLTPMQEENEDEDALQPAHCWALQLGCCQTSRPERCWMSQLGCCLILQSGYSRFPIRERG